MVLYNYMYIIVNYFMIIQQRLILTYLYIYIHILVQTETMWFTNSSIEICDFVSIYAFCSFRPITLYYTMVVHSLSQNRLRAVAHYYEYGVYIFTSHKPDWKPFIVSSLTFLRTSFEHEKTTLKTRTYNKIFLACLEVSQW